MTTNFKNVFTGKNKSKRTTPRRNGLQPRFEALEERRMMAATIWETPGIDGKIEVVAVGTTGTDQITVNPYTQTQQITTRSGTRTITIPMIEVRIKDAAGNSLVRSYEQAKVGELMLYGDQGNDTITNNSSIPSHIRGEGGNDTIYGGSSDDTIYGDGSTQQSGGQNKLYGRGGNDHLYGGDLHDELWGGIGDDDLYGESGDDYLYGQDGKDELFGDGGNDFLFGGLHDDEIWGGNGDDFLWGEGGNDLLVGEGGSDHLYGGADKDILMGGFRHFNVRLAQQQQQGIADSTIPIYTQEDDGCADHLWGGDGLDQVYFNPGSDWMDGWLKIGGGATGGLNPSGWYEMV